jgi:DNA repair exonuclease SbcCD ATPase subunit
LLSNLGSAFGNELGQHAAVANGDSLTPASATGLLAIRNANQALEARTADQLHSAIVVLFEQRDRALVELGSLAANAEQERQRLNAEHDRFVAFLMEEHERKLNELQTQLARAHEALTRRRAFALGGHEANAAHAAALENGTSEQPAASASVALPGVETPESHAAASREQLKDLRRLLEMAYTELDEQKEIVARLEQERDAAICAADDARVAIYSELETARDQLNAMQDQLEDAQRQLEEARDQAREEAHALSERVHDADRELDERRAEVARLRERINSLTQEIQVSHPPPPPVSDELSKARDEVQRLRRQLIDTKRQLSKLTREYASLKTQRVQLVRAQMPLRPPAVSGPAAEADEAPALREPGVDTSGE